MTVHAVAEMTMDEFAELAKKTDVAIIPVGTLEAHGSHGPLGFDNYTAEEIARRLASRIEAFLMPTVTYGCCKLVYDATNFPGTFSLSPETMSAFYSEIGKELARQGVRRILFTNGHVGNSPALMIAAYRIWSETGTAVGILEHWVAAPEVRAKVFKRPGHAGESETSLLLACEGAKHLKMDRAKVYLPEDTASEKEVKGAGITSYTKVMATPNYGDPHDATKEKGEALISVLVERGLAMLETLKTYVRT